MIRRAIGRLLCQRGCHDWARSTSGLAAYCRRPGCGAYWEYD